MSDGNTAVSISPVPSEDEMNGIKRIFDRAANAIVQASELSKLVSELEAKFNVLSHDFDLIKDRNASLDEALQDVRRQRDTAMAERDQAQTLVRELGTKLELETANGHRWEESFNQLQAKLEAMTKDRDDADEAWKASMSEADDAKAKLAAIQKALGLPEAIAKPEPLTPTPPTSQPVAITDHGMPDTDPDTRHDPWPTPTEHWKHD